MRDKILEVMARGVFENFRVEEVGPAVVSWDAHGCHVPAHDAYLDAARAALTALQAEGMVVVPGWQTIETAPKDGSLLWLLVDGEAVIGHFRRPYRDLDGDKGDWRISAIIKRRERSDLDAGIALTSGSIKPSRWQPMLAAALPPRSE